MKKRKYFNIHRFHFTFILSTLVFLCAAQDFSYEGVNYTVISDEEGTCRTKRGGGMPFISGNADFSGELVIPETVSYNNKEYSVIEIGYYSFYNNENITSLTLPFSLLLVDDYAFAGCVNIVGNLDFPSHLEGIGNSAFEGCENLGPQISLSESLIELGAMAFKDCTGITSEILIPKGMTTIGYGTFRNCSALSGVSLPPNLSSIGEHAFEGCSSIRELQLPETVNQIGRNAFAFASSLFSINLPEGITSIEKDTFQGCKSLSSIDLPESLTFIDAECFFACSLTDLVIPDNVTTIRFMAFDSNELVSVSLGNSISFIGASAFGDNSNLKDFYCLAPMPPVVEESPGLSPDIPPGYFISGWDINLQDITLHVPESSLDAYSDDRQWNGFGEILPIEISGEGEISEFSYEGINYTVLSKDNKKCATTSGDYFQSGTPGLKGDVIIPETVEFEGNVYTVTAIGNFSFYGSNEITSISLPETLVSVGKSAFGKCTSLQSINWPSGVTVMESDVLSQCSSLREFYMPDAVTVVGSGAFAGCSVLKEIRLSDSLEIIEEQAFSGCHSLGSISIPDSVKIIERFAFSGCSSIASVELGCNIEEIEACAFNECAEVRKVISYNPIPPAVNNDKFGGGIDQSFYRDKIFSNPQLADLYVPFSSIELYREAIGWEYFKNYYPIYGENTSVDELDPEQSTETLIYNLQGVRMGGDVNALSPGIYIVNGKKVVVR